MNVPTLPRQAMSADTSDAERAARWRRQLRSPRADRAPDRERWTRDLCAAVVIVICALICWHIYVRAERGWPALTGAYTLIVASYVLSRFVLAAMYRPPRDRGYEPAVAIVIPAYNEGRAIVETITACLAVDYPRHLLSVVVVNDGSTDDTGDEIARAAAALGDDRLLCIDLGQNQGKRAALAAGIRATTAEILVFVDSDSVPARDAVRKLVQAFAEPDVGCVAGLSHARNGERNALTRMQATRYLVSFQLLKAAESVVGAVTCCSGCFAAYRRAAVTELMDEWENQRFLGRGCTYGDDRALTNMVIRTGWRSLYDRRAEAWTDAPTDYPTFFRQQLRWKKSWAREGPLLLGQIWRTRPVAFPFVFMQTVCGFLSPVVLIVNLVHPAFGGGLPVVYLLGLYLLAMAYAMFYCLFRRDSLWPYAVLATGLYILITPQLIWAILRIRDGRWGTRQHTAPAPVPLLAEHGAPA